MVRTVLTAEGSFVPACSFCFLFLLTVPKHHGEDSQEKVVFAQKGHGGNKQQAHAVVGVHPH